MENIHFPLEDGLDQAITLLTVQLLSLIILHIPLVINNLSVPGRVLFFPLCHCGI